jgi:hypothetical protein
MMVRLPETFAVPELLLLLLLLVVDALAVYNERDSSAANATHMMLLLDFFILTPHIKFFDFLLVC